MTEAACKAHWPTWDRMRPDLQRKWRAKMGLAIAAALTAQRAANQAKLDTMYPGQFQR